MKNRIVCWVMCLVMLVGCLCGCSEAEKVNKNHLEAGQLL